MTITKTIIRTNNNYDFFKVIIGKEKATFNNFIECEEFCKKYWEKQKNKTFCFSLDKARVEGEYDFCQYELYAILEANL